MLNYFAYASNLNRKQMSERCPGSKPRFVATLPNYKLIFAGWSRTWRGGVASIKRFKGEKVVGAVYEIFEKELRQLDRYEGHPDIYNRIKVLVFTEDGEAVEAVTYIMRDQSQESQPSEAYLTTIRQGYKDWQIA